MINKIIDNKDWAALEDRFEWVRDMSHVEQHKLYHREGNVAIHTQLVLSELRSVEEYSELTEWQQEVLWVATLLHDVEKRSTSVDHGGGVISARGHAEKGEYTARAVLYKDLPVSFHVREEIASLVALHGLPLWFIDKGDPYKNIIASSLRLETRMLKILSEADARGRRCADLEPLIESLHDFKAFCIQEDCWTKPYSFINDYARYHYLNSDSIDANDVGNTRFKCKVTLISGLPRIGKDSYIKNTYSDDIPIITFDEYIYSVSDNEKGSAVRLQEAKAKALTYIQKGQDFIWNSANVKRIGRDSLISFFIEHGAEVEIVYIERPYTEWLQLNQKSDNPLLITELDSLIYHFEVPLLTEAHHVKYEVY